MVFLSHLRQKHHQDQVILVSPSPGETSSRLQTKNRQTKMRERIENISFFRKTKVSNFLMAVVGSCCINNGNIKSFLSYTLNYIFIYDFLKNVILQTTKMF